MCEEAPAFVRGLTRQEQAAQTADLHLASQEQRPDRPKGDGDGVRASGPAAVAGQTAFCGVETVGHPFSDWRFAAETVVQNRVVSGDPEEADLEEAQKRLRHGGPFQEPKKIPQKEKRSLVLFVFRRELIREIDQVGSGQRFFQIGADAGKMREDVAPLDQGQALRSPPRKVNPGAGKGLQGVYEPFPASSGPFGDSPDLPEVRGAEGDDPVGFAVIDDPQNNGLRLLWCPCLNHVSNRGSESRRRRSSGPPSPSGSSCERGCSSPGNGKVRDRRSIPSSGR